MSRDIGKARTLILGVRVSCFFVVRSRVRVRRGGCRRSVRDSSRQRRAPYVCRQRDLLSGPGVCRSDSGSRGPHTANVWCLPARLAADGEAPPLPTSGGGGTLAGYHVEHCGPFVRGLGRAVAGVCGRHLHHGARSALAAPGTSQPAKAKGFEVFDQASPAERGTGLGAHRFQSFVRAVESGGRRPAPLASRVVPHGSTPDAGARTWCPQFRESNRSNAELRFGLSSRRELRSATRLRVGGSTPGWR
jgi:hypothetical protein